MISLCRYSWSKKPLKHDKWPSLLVYFGQFPPTPLDLSFWVHSSDQHASIILYMDIGYIDKLHVIVHVYCLALMINVLPYPPLPK